MSADPVTLCLDIDESTLLDPRVSLYDTPYFLLGCNSTTSFVPELPEVFTNSYSTHTNQATFDPTWRWEFGWCYLGSALKHPRYGHPSWSDHSVTPLQWPHHHGNWLVTSCCCKFWRTWTGISQNNHRVRQFPLLLRWNNVRLKCPLPLSIPGEDLSSAGLGCSSGMRQKLWYISVYTVCWPYNVIWKQNTLWHSGRLYLLQKHWTPLRSWYWGEQSKESPGHFIDKGLNRELCQASDQFSEGGFIKDFSFTYEAAARDANRLASLISHSGPVYTNLVC